MSVSWIHWQCPECDKETAVEVVHPVAAQTYGPPERCYPAESGEITPDQCGHCEATIDYDKALEQAAEEMQAAKEHAAEERAERWRERQEELRAEQREQWERDQ